MNINTILRLAMAAVVLFSVCLPLEYAQAQSIASILSSKTLHLSQPVEPVLLKGIKIDPQQPLRMEFIVSESDYNSHEVIKSQGHKNEYDFEVESTKLIKYFLAALTTPEKDLWVNLSPNEPDRIVEEHLGETEMGRDLLAQDYLLKQLTASLLHPDNEYGQQFWAKIYQEAFDRFGTTEIPVDTFHKVWIVPEVAEIYEKDHAVYITKATLDVKLERDYVAEKSHKVIKSQSHNQNGPEGIKSYGHKKKRKNQWSEKNSEIRHVEESDVFYDAMTYDSMTVTNEDDFSSAVMKEVIIPAIKKEVNEGANFVPLRQIYHSLILATWHKKKIKQSVLNKVYVDQQKTAGVDHGDLNAIPNLYGQYVNSVQGGLFDFVREESLVSGGNVPRHYFSGGVDAAMISVSLRQSDESQVPKELDHAQVVTVNYQVNGAEDGFEDLAMSAPGNGVFFNHLSEEQERSLNDVVRQYVSGRTPVTFSSGMLVQNIASLWDDSALFEHHVPDQFEGATVGWFGPGSGELELREFLEQYPQVKEMVVFDKSKEVLAYIQKQIEAWAKTQKIILPAMRYRVVDLTDMPMEYRNGRFDFIYESGVFDRDFFSDEHMNRVFDGVWLMLVDNGVYFSTGLYSYQMKHLPPRAKHGFQIYDLPAQEESNSMENVVAIVKDPAMQGITSEAEIVLKQLIRLEVLKQFGEEDGLLGDGFVPLDEIEKFKLTLDWVDELGLRVGNNEKKKKGDWIYQVGLDETLTSFVALMSSVQFSSIIDDGKFSFQIKRLKAPFGYLWNEFITQGRVHRDFGTTYAQAPTLTDELSLILFHHRISDVSLKEKMRALQDVKTGGHIVYVAPKGKRINREIVDDYIVEAQEVGVVLSLESSQALERLYPGRAIQLKVVSKESDVAMLSQRIDDNLLKELQDRHLNGELLVFDPDQQKMTLVQYRRADSLKKEEYLNVVRSLMYWSDPEFEDFQNNLLEQLNIVYQGGESSYLKDFRFAMNDEGFVLGWVKLSYERNALDVLEVNRPYQRRGVAVGLQAAATQELLDQGGGQIMWVGVYQSLIDALTQSNLIPFIIRKDNTKLLLNHDGVENFQFDHDEARRFVDRQKEYVMSKVREYGVADDLAMSALPITNLIEGQDVPNVFSSVFGTALTRGYFRIIDEKRLLDFDHKELNILMIGASNFDVELMFERYPNSFITVVNLEAELLQNIQSTFYQDRVRAPRLKLYQANAANLDSDLFKDASFDFIFAEGVDQTTFGDSIEERRNGVEVLKQIAKQEVRLLKPGGYIYHRYFVDADLEDAARYYPEAIESGVLTPINVIESQPAFLMKKTKDSSMQTGTGGIDLVGVEGVMDADRDGAALELNVDEAMVSQWGQLQHAQGLSPVILGSRPLVNLRVYLGI